jgi:AmmeMemoRadiSam system protein B
MERGILRSLFVISFSFLCWGVFHAPDPAKGEDALPDDIRSSVLAGSWYPENRAVLSKTIRGFLAGAEPSPVEGSIRAIIVPHAGYTYSGPVAAHAYRLIQNGPFKRVVLIGPSHRVAFRGVSVNLQSAYETPLGRVSVDQVTAKKILDSDPERIHWVRKAHEQEHSLEIQLPFLQEVLPNARIVPIIMGQQDYETCSHLARTLLKVLGDGGDTLLIASTDLSHFYSRERANRLDNRFIEHVIKFDPEGLAADLSTGACEACGGGPVITTMLVSRGMGASRSVILDHADSGRATGDTGRVVGYLAAALIKSSDRDPHPK